MCFEKFILDHVGMFQKNHSKRHYMRVKKFIHKILKNLFWNAFHTFKFYSENLITKIIFRKSD